MAFDINTTAEEAVADLDLSGKTYLVTGGTSGLGREAARCIALKGAQVVLMGSSQERGDKAVDELSQASGSDKISFVQAPFDDLRQVDVAATWLLNSLGRLDGIVASAGIMAVDFGRTKDGLERQFGINHIAHHHLVSKLLPLLRADGGARVVTVTSGAHRLDGVDLDDPNFTRREYDRWNAYAQSKSANILFVNALNAREAANGIEAFTVAPGVVTDTSLHTHLTDEHFAPLGERQPYLIDAITPKNSGQGAATITWAAVHPQLDGCGGYFLEDFKVRLNNSDPLDHEDVMPRVRDVNKAQKLWALSDRIVADILNINQGVA